MKITLKRRAVWLHNAPDRTGERTGMTREGARRRTRVQVAEADEWPVTNEVGIRVRNNELAVRELPEPSMDIRSGPSQGFNVAVTVLCLHYYTRRDTIAQVQGEPWRKNKTPEGCVIYSEALQNTRLSVQGRNPWPVSAVSFALFYQR